MPLGQSHSDFSRGPSRRRHDRQSEERIAMAFRISTSRRDFIKTGSGLVLGFSLIDSAVVPHLVAADTAVAPAPGRLDAWLRIADDETIQVFTGKVEIGMG